MSKATKYFKENMLGIAVAFGVCAFLYDSFFSGSFDFELTKFACLILFIVAIRTRYNDNLERDNSLKRKRVEKDFDETNS